MPRMQTAMPTKPANKEENSPDALSKAKSSKSAADPADAYKVEAAKIKTSFTNRMFKRMRVTWRRVRYNVFGASFLFLGIQV